MVFDKTNWSIGRVVFWIVCFFSWASFAQVAQGEEAVGWYSCESGECTPIPNVNDMSLLDFETMADAKRPNENSVLIVEDGAFRWSNPVLDDNIYLELPSQTEENQSDDLIFDENEVDPTSEGDDLVFDEDEVDASNEGADLVFEEDEGGMSDESTGDLVFDENEETSYQSCSDSGACELVSLPSLTELDMGTLTGMDPPSPNHQVMKIDGTYHWVSFDETAPNEQAGPFYHCLAGVCVQVDVSGVSLEEIELIAGRKSPGPGRVLIYANGQYRWIKPDLSTPAPSRNVFNGTNCQRLIARIHADSERADAMVLDGSGRSERYFELVGEATQAQMMGDQRRCWLIEAQLFL